jgi:hypothetical protein
MSDALVTAAELDAMTPAERQADFESRLVLDPAQLPARFQRTLVEQDERVAALVAAEEQRQAS